MQNTKPVRTYSSSNTVGWIVVSTTLTTISDYRLLTFSQENVSCRARSLWFFGGAAWCRLTMGFTLVSFIEIGGFASS